MYVCMYFFCKSAKNRKLAYFCSSCQFNSKSTKDFNAFLNTYSKINTVNRISYLVNLILTQIAVPKEI